MSNRSYHRQIPSQQVNIQLTIPYLKYVGLEVFQITFHMLEYFHISNKIA